MKRGWWIGKFVLMGLVALGVIGLVTMTLWNWLVPTLFSGPVITYWQALGLLALSKILFWTFGRKGGSHQHGPWKPYWKQKWASMTPEEQEKLRTRMRDKWCQWDKNTSASDSDTSNV